MTRHPIAALVLTAALAGIVELGATRDWREEMREHLGEELSAKPMLEYFQPLLDFLRVQNEGREHALPETLDL